MNRNYVVIGAGGFIGKALSKELLNQSFHTILVGKNIESEPNPRACIYDCFITDFNFLDRHINKNTIVYYLINTMSPQTKDSSDFLHDHNLFFKFLTWATKHPYIKIIFTSSGGTVYKEKSSPHKEHDELNPTSLYSLSKISSEQNLRFFSSIYNIKYVITRISNPFGPGQIFSRGQGFIPLAFKKILEKEPLTIIGDGSMVRDYIYIDDLINALVGASTCQPLENSTVNIGTGNATSVLDIVKYIENITFKKANIVFDKNCSGVIKKNILNPQKLKENTSWYPQISVEQGINMYYNYIINQSV